MDDFTAAALIAVLGYLGLHGLFYRDANRRWPPAYILFAAVTLFEAGELILERFIW